HAFPNVYYSGRRSELRTESSKEEDRIPKWAGFSDREKEIIRTTLMFLPGKFNFKPVNIFADNLKNRLLQSGSIGILTIIFGLVTFLGGVAAPLVFYEYVQSSHSDSSMFAMYAGVILMSFVGVAFLVWSIKTGEGAVKWKTESKVFVRTGIHEQAFYQQLALKLWKLLDQQGFDDPFPLSLKEAENQIARQWKARSELRSFSSEPNKIESLSDLVDLLNQKFALHQIRKYIEASDPESIAHVIEFCDAMGYDYEPLLEILSLMGNPVMAVFGSLIGVHEQIRSRINKFSRNIVFDPAADPVFRLETRSELRSSVMEASLVRKAKPGSIQRGIRKAIHRIWGDSPGVLAQARELIWVFGTIPGIGSVISKFKAEHHNQLEEHIGELRAAEYLKDHVRGAEIIGFELHMGDENQEVDLLLKVKKRGSVVREGDIILPDGIYLVEVKADRRKFLRWVVRNAIQSLQIKRYLDAAREYQYEFPIRGVIVIAGGARALGVRDFELGVLYREKSIFNSIPIFSMALRWDTKRNSWTAVPNEAQIKAWAHHNQNPDDILRLHSKNFTGDDLMDGTSSAVPYVEGISSGEVENYEALRERLQNVFVTSDSTDRVLQALVGAAYARREDPEASGHFEVQDIQLENVPAGEKYLIRAFYKQRLQAWSIVLLEENKRKQPDWEPLRIWRILEDKIPSLETIESRSELRSSPISLSTILHRPSLKNPFGNINGEVGTALTFNQLSQGRLGLDFAPIAQMSELRATQLTQPIEIKKKVFENQKSGVSIFKLEVSNQDDQLLLDSVFTKKFHQNSPNEYFLFASQDRDVMVLMRSVSSRNIIDLVPIHPFSEGSLPKFISAFVMLIIKMRYEWNDFLQESFGVTATHWNAGDLSGGSKKEILSIHTAPEEVKKMEAGGKIQFAVEWQPADESKPVQEPTGEHTVGPILVRDVVAGDIQTGTRLYRLKVLPEDKESLREAFDDQSAPDPNDKLRYNLFVAKDPTQSGRKIMILIRNSLQKRRIDAIPVGFSLTEENKDAIMGYFAIELKKILGQK
ncbi:MAG: hypothetical protein HY582_03455, partial [Candidatus Omnitrophica bacterium]|nr:hypothetical protein [Candidatus Omnitrophota bacterium]